ncbi:hypothetical protein C41B8_09641 [Salinisphaera hydrothermalis C41B8]|uniref:T6SS Phospholipase effector Tle1-like catalytic domain-containing protein n=1 Tax=Salinisphaera hydrothermalis (strain C41B8) TaxID=1304275 RepID=A0A084IL69_SALHC|nr:hypothetical protein C41B8_09641 [Salinisphaera hydrothermalis C41B8]
MLRAVFRFGVVVSKNIAIFCDGTNDQFGSVTTNVVHLLRLSERDSDRQRTFYEPGVGTFGANLFSVNIGTFLGKLLGAAFGYGLAQNLTRAYRYVVETHEPGDRVFIFGFSRGAFTARSLARLLDAGGLPEPGDSRQLERIVETYLVDGADALSRYDNARVCRPHFVGVWDTVAALGVLLRWHRFDDRCLSPGVAHAAQALAIDEQRAAFEPTLWAEPEADQSIHQVWFAGVHSDIGGGYRDRGLADITLYWMLGQARRCGLHLAPHADPDRPGDALGRRHDSYVGCWRWLGRHRRRVPPNASIHASVRTRMQACPAYAPGNLPGR